MDNLTPEQRRRNMQRIRSKNTAPELAVFRALKSRGIFFVKHYDKLPGKPDIVFRRKRVAVFIDSDFWHGHPERFPMPKSNQEYWTKKIEGNRRRDAIVNEQLKQSGWTVIRLWVYDVKHDLEACISQILQAIQRDE